MVGLVLLQLAPDCATQVTQPGGKLGQNCPAGTQPPARNPQHYLSSSAHCHQPPCNSAYMHTLTRLDALDLLTCLLNSSHDLVAQHVTVVHAGHVVEVQVQV
jgi:hypothetical protein